MAREMLRLRGRQMKQDVLFHLPHYSAAGSTSTGMALSRSS
jgi:hypothetical protein